MNYSNYHTHSTYCDGKNTLREIVESAINLSCPEIGFSGHSHMEFQPKSFAMTLEKTEEYKKEIKALKAEYSDKIRIYCGIEQEFMSQKLPEGFDYCIGSVHYLENDGEFCGIDLSPEEQLYTVKKYYNNDFLSYAKAYYELVKQVPKTIPCQILGHFDLITKFNEKHKFLDEDSKEYQSIALEALEEVCQSKIVLELNSGAISRNWKTEIYPAPFILKRLGELHQPVVFSADSHSADTLIFKFEKMSELAKEYKLTVCENMDDIQSYANS